MGARGAPAFFGSVKNARGRKTAPKETTGQAEIPATRVFATDATNFRGEIVCARDAAKLGDDFQIVGEKAGQNAGAPAPGRMQKTPQRGLFEIPISDPKMTAKALSKGAGFGHAVSPFTRSAPRVTSDSGLPKI
jgi:hypothetical protein